MAILGGADVLAVALDISPRAVRYKLAGERGVSDDDLTRAAAALDERAARVSAHADKLRAAAAPPPSTTTSGATE